MKTTAEKLARFLSAFSAGLPPLVCFCAPLYISYLLAENLVCGGRFDGADCRTIGPALEPIVYFSSKSAGDFAASIVRIACVVISVIGAAVCFIGAFRARERESAWRWFVAMIAVAMSAAVVTLVVWGATLTPSDVIDIYF